MIRRVLECKIWYRSAGRRAADGDEDIVVFDFMIGFCL